jgi:hypothetical protein
MDRARLAIFALTVVAIAMPAIAWEDPAEQVIDVEKIR